MKSIIYGTCLTVLLVCSMTSAAPEPKVVQPKGLWTAELVFEPLQQLIYQPSPDVQPQRFWYIILTLTNNSGQDMDFHPRCDLLTDTFQLVPAYERIPPSISNMIRNRHQTKYPLLQSMASVGNRLLQGEDHAKDVIVVWPDFDPEAAKASLFIAGLSNETALVKHPTLKDAEGNPTPFFLRKTLELNFKLRSEAGLRTNADVRFVDKRWVMR
ncbi:hypothetical protein ACFL6U_08050 [Planctomycetota bacterium]